MVFKVDLLTSNVFDDYWGYVYHFIVGPNHNGAPLISVHQLKIRGLCIVSSWAHIITWYSVDQCTSQLKTGGLCIVSLSAHFIVVLRWSVYLQMIIMCLCIYSWWAHIIMVLLWSVYLQNESSVSVYLFFVGMLRQSVYLLCCVSVYLFFVGPYHNGAPLISVPTNWKSCVCVLFLSSFNLHTYQLDCVSYIRDLNIITKWSQWFICVSQH